MDTLISVSKNAMRKIKIIIIIISCLLLKNKRQDIFHCISINFLFWVLKRLTVKGGSDFCWKHLTDLQICEHDALILTTSETTYKFHLVLH